MTQQCLIQDPRSATISTRTRPPSPAAGVVRLPRHGAAAQLFGPGLGSSRRPFRSRRHCRCAPAPRRVTPGARRFRSRRVWFRRGRRPSPSARELRAWTALPASGWVLNSFHPPPVSQWLGDEVVPSSPCCLMGGLFRYPASSSFDVHFVGRKHGGLGGRGGNVARTLAWRASSRAAGLAAYSQHHSDGPARSFFSSVGAWRCAFNNESTN